MENKLNTLGYPSEAYDRLMAHNGQYLKGYKPMIMRPKPYTFELRIHHSLVGRDYSVNHYDIEIEQHLDPTRGFQPWPEEQLYGAWDRATRDRAIQTRLSQLTASGLVIHYHTVYHRMDGCEAAQ